MSQHTIGYTGTVRRGYALKPGASNETRLEDITEPCPTCGQPAVRQTYDSTRADGTYRVTQLRCPNANIRKPPRNGLDKMHQAKANACPIHQREIKIGDTPMPVQKICTVIPKPEDQEEYKRLKAVLGIDNKEFIKLSLLTNSPVYDWFAGRAISPQTEAKILHAIKDLQKREGKPVVKPVVNSTNGHGTTEVCNDAENLSKEPKIEFSAAAVDNAEKRLTNLHTRITFMDERLTVAENEINGLARSVEHIEKSSDYNNELLTGLAKSVSHLEEDADAEPEIEGELYRVQIGAAKQLPSVWDLAAEMEKAALLLLSADPNGHLYDAVVRRLGNRYD